MSKNLYLQLVSWQGNGKLDVIPLWMLSNDNDDDHTEVLDPLLFSLEELKKELRGKLR